VRIQFFLIILLYCSNETKGNSENLHRYFAQLYKNEAREAQLPSTLSNGDAGRHVTSWGDERGRVLRPWSSVMLHFYPAH